MAKAPIVPTAVRGAPRVALLRLHRLLEFERVFSLYLEGKTSAQHVRKRAELMLAVGLPKFAIPRQRGKSKLWH